MTGEGKGGVKGTPSEWKRGSVEVHDCFDFAIRIWV